MKKWLINMWHGVLLLWQQMVLTLLYMAGTMPLAAQEQALVEDLLFVLVGVDGRDITAQPVLGRQNRSFIVDATLDMSVKELVNRILPVASYYSTITRWVFNSLTHCFRAFFTNKTLFTFFGAWFLALLRRSPPLSMVRSTMHLQQPWGLWWRST